MNSLSLCLLVVCLLVVVSPAFGDVYMHMLRGSNNRLNEANRERNNANRLFDSQNNNRGGYNVGSSYYSVGEIVRLEWTNQHSCNSGNAFCELILQYTCDDWLRDGTTTNRIPNEEKEDGNPEFGRHESYWYYQWCSTRQRNRGLFTASQNLNGDTARFTRQNPNGNRYGFECPEERDYYPYWHATPWKDIAIFTDNMTRCREVYQVESQNVKNKGACYNETEPFNLIYSINNAPACEALRHVWKEDGAWNISAPLCVPAPWSRDNHLGNTFGGETSAWNWTVPNDIHERCALRLRYNISTNDYPYDTNATYNDEDGLKLDLAARFQSPNPYPFDDDPDVNIGNGLELELAINTAQFGRTFQDRSHRFSIRARPDEIPADDNIYAIQVRGKRGNIVQTFPATEYDFTPNDLYVTTDDWLHFVWTGSNTNPNNNNGEGREQSDRSNIVPITDYGNVIPVHLNFSKMWIGVENYRIGDITQYYMTSFMSMTGTGVGQFGGELSQLDDAATYFDSSTFKISEPGTYKYMSSRNNNFSNRQQKATVSVKQGNDSKLSSGALAGIIIGAILGFILLAALAILAAIWYRKHMGVEYSAVAQSDSSSMYRAPE